jgi:hypothetical protein
MMDERKAVPPSPERPRLSEMQGATQGGVVCRECECREFRVVKTTPLYDGRIRRRRECRHCGKRLTTVERSL